MRQVEYEINLVEAVKEVAEEIVSRGTVAGECERVIISTLAKLCELLFRTMDSTDDEWAEEMQALQQEMWFFLPAMTEAILVLVREHKTEVLDGIRRLAACHTGDTRGNSNFNGVYRIMWKDEAWLTKN